MNLQFVDFETAKMLRELKFNYSNHPAEAPNLKLGYFTSDGNVYETGMYDEKATNSFPRPLWFQVKDWLWQNHDKWIDISTTQENAYYGVLRNIKYDIITEWENIFATPMQAEIDGVKNTVKYLYECVLAVTPNNTKPNSH